MFINYVPKKLCPNEKKERKGQRKERKSQERKGQ